MNKKYTEKEIQMALKLTSVREINSNKISLFNQQDCEDICAKTCTTVFTATLCNIHYQGLL